MQFSYAGIPFEMVKTNSWNCEAVYSDDGADYLYTHITIDAEFVLNPKLVAYTLQDGLAISTPGTLPATTFAAIRQVIMQPRQQLSVYDIDGQIILELPANGEFEDGVVDAHLGPKPLRCQPRVTGSSQTWEFRWVVECWINECYAFGPFGNGMLSYRWQDEHHINQNHLTTRIITGTAKFRNDWLNNGDLTVDEFRKLLFHKPLPGFQRTNVDVVAKSDGTALQIMIRDEERMYDLGNTDARADGAGLKGSGIIRVEGAFGVTSISTDAGPAAGMSMQQFDCRVYGNKYSNQWTMIQRAFQLALSKISGIGAGQIGIIRHAAVRESLGQDEKWVEVSIAFQANPVQNAGIGSLRLNGLRKSVEDLFQPQNGLNPNMPNANGNQGTAIVDLVTKQLNLILCYPVSYDDVAPGEGGEGDGTVSDNEGPPPAYSVESRDELDETESKYGDTETDPYTHYRSQITISRTTGLAMAPATGQQPAYQPGGGSSGGGSSGGGSVQTPPASDDWGGATGAFEGASGESQSGLAPSRFFRFTYPSEKITMQFEAERLGSAPAIPSPRNTDGKMVLLFARLQPRSPVIANDGVTPVCYVEGFYEYGRQLPIGPGESVPMGALPWTTIAFAESVIEPDDFEHGIFDDEAADGAELGPSV